MYNKVVNKIVILLSFLIFISIGFLPIKDTDFGWHYRCGNQFLTTGKLCLTNEFSYYLSDYKAYYSGHLYDVILAFIYNHGGFLAVSLFGAFIFALSLFFLSRITKQPFIVSSMLFLGIFYLSYHVFGLGLRPQILSFLFMIILLYVLEHKNTKMLFIIPLLFIFWVNVHIGFFVGLIILGFKIFQKSIQQVIIFSCLLVSSFITSLVNPFGIGVYTEIINHAFAPLNTMIAEWTAPPIFQIIIIFVFLFITIFIIIKKKSITFFQIFLLIFFTLLSLKAQRNIPFLYLSIAYVLFSQIKLSIEKFTPFFFALFSSIFIFFLVIQIPATYEFDTNWSEICAKTTLTPYPCVALQKFPQLSGNVFTNYEWGGFLIWQKPNVKVFVDGRMSAWIASDNTYPYQTYLEIMQARNNWNKKLKDLKTDYILINTNTFLDLALKKDFKKYGWIEKYRDHSSVIYKAI